MEFRFTLRDNGMRAAFQLLHMVLEVNILPAVIFKRFLILICCIYKLLPILLFFFASALLKPSCFCYAA